MGGTVFLAGQEYDITRLIVPIVINSVDLEFFELLDRIVSHINGDMDKKIFKGCEKVLDPLTTVILKAPELRVVTAGINAAPNTVQSAPKCTTMFGTILAASFTVASLTGCSQTVFTSFFPVEKF